MNDCDISTRFNDHLGYVRRKESRRCVARHVMESGHQIGENSARSLWYPENLRNWSHPYPEQSQDTDE